MKKWTEKMSKEEMNLRALLLRGARRFRKASCEWCGSKKRLEIHHKNENWRDNALENLQTLCQPCHLRLHRSGQLEEKTCSVDGCDRIHKGRGFCEMHLDRVKATGSTEKRAKQSSPCRICGAAYDSTKGSRADLCNTHRLEARRRAHC